MNLRYVWALLIWAGCGTVFGQGYIPTQGFPPTSTPSHEISRCAILEKIYRAYDSGDHAFISKAASKYRKDPCLFPTCQLFRYLWKEIGPDELIRSFPSEHEQFGEFVGGTEESCDDAKRSRTLDGTPIFEYYSQLISLMEKGNRKAAQKVLETSEFTDGEVAEGLAPDIWGFCLKHPDLVLENWDLYRAHQNRLSGFFEDASPEDLEKMRKGVLALKGDSKAKKEFLNLIDQGSKSN